jgi:trans-2,3-dihydro-3-hydroxyanthranilate isomerase
VEIGRPSDLFLSAQLQSAKVSDVRVGGSTVLVANGRLFLPRCTRFQQEFILASDGKG